MKRKEEKKKDKKRPEIIKGKPGKIISQQTPAWLIFLFWSPSLCGDGDRLLRIIRLQ
jgi:hypothetical protein